MSRTRARSTSHARLLLDAGDWTVKKSNKALLMGLMTEWGSQTAKKQTNAARRIRVRPTKQTKAQWERDGERGSLGQGGRGGLWEEATAGEAAPVGEGRVWAAQPRCFPISPQLFLGLLQLSSFSEQGHVVASPVSWASAWGRPREPETLAVPSAPPPMQPISKAARSGP